MGIPARLRLASLLLCALPAPAPAMEVAAAEQYGRVILDGFTRKAGVPPVTFDHWRHRARFTCRLCHVDVGFSMAAGATRISASTNRARFHCGACHNGRTAYKGKAVFGSCSTTRNVDEADTCRRCHGRPDPARQLREFNAFAEGMPRRAVGGSIDWEEAETQGRIRPVDHVEGVSIRRPALKMDKEISIESRGTWMSDVLFSHKKHAIWNGCEVCHPEIFPSTKHGTVKYTMMEISAGGYCGVCHQKVAFPIADCERCHVKPVR